MSFPSASGGGSHELNGWAPAFAGVTKKNAGVTKKNAGVTKESAGLTPFVIPA